MVNIDQSYNQIKNSGIFVSQPHNLAHKDTFPYQENS
jgi:hypothetical protein